jgi:UDP-N-acetylmuramoyl-tripeptide--D-alanyl-D-alanine ligase
MFTLRQAAQWLDGARLVGDDAAATAVTRVNTDTRSLQPGDLFVALRGERFDAHDFLPQARAQGAVAAIAESGLAAAGLAGLEVPDGRAALGQLAAGWRAQFTLPLIAVTGSNGKTTVTQMIAAILRAWRGESAFSTQGNLNNDVGVPLTLMRLRGDHAVGVVELGMNHPGEIDLLARITQPTVALVNNAQREHQEFMATVHAVAQENGSVLTALPADGTAVFPAGEEFTALWRTLAADRACLTFGDSADADVRLLQADWSGSAWQVRASTPAGALDFALAVAGRHNVRNALAAAACALAAGAPLAAIASGLAGFSPVKGRSRAFAVQAGGRAITVVDDTYNANPDSVRAAIDVLAELPAPRLLVLGDMGEVGQEGPRFHAEVGAYARERGIDGLFTLGEAASGSASAFGAGARDFGADAQALCSAVVQALAGQGSVLVKGSRFMKMERVVQAIDAATTATQNNKEGA